MRKTSTVENEETSHEEVILFGVETVDYRRSVFEDVSFFNSATLDS
jgi:hypothetical protein